MTKEEFAKALFELEEMCSKLKLPLTQVGDCGGQCQGLDEDDYMDLCPQCLDAFYRETGMVRCLSNNSGFVELSRKIENALEQDTKGELAEVFSQFGAKTSKENC